ncbi:hypothetical protein SEA_WATERT_88 [Microbacterium phage WaterT]|nr:hypothetical protein SEA_WATERT_88 [Microbacterium phage WaterT]
MTELKYDPDLPYVVEWQPGSVWARFHQASDAREYVEREGGTFVDTTPKPKIPEDANYVFVEDGDQSVFAYRIVFPDGRNGWMMVGNGPISEEDLLELYIGDELVTVMVEKEDA